MSTSLAIEYPVMDSKYLKLIDQQYQRAKSKLKNELNDDIPIDLRISNKKGALTFFEYVEKWLGDCSDRILILHADSGQGKTIVSLEALKKYKDEKWLKDVVGSNGKRLTNIFRFEFCVNGEPLIEISNGTSIRDFCRLGSSRQGAVIPDDSGVLDSSLIIFDGLENLLEEARGYNLDNIESCFDEFCELSYIHNAFIIITVQTAYIRSYLSEKEDFINVNDKKFTVVQLVPPSESDQTAWLGKKITVKGLEDNEKIRLQRAKSFIDEIRNNTEVKAGVKKLLNNTLTFTKFVKYYNERVTIDDLEKEVHIYDYMLKITIKPINDAVEMEQRLENCTRDLEKLALCSFKGKNDCDFKYLDKFKTIFAEKHKNKYEFTHDSYRRYYLAKWIVNNILNVNKSVREFLCNFAYNQLEPETISFIREIRREVEDDKDDIKNRKMVIYEIQDVLDKTNGYIPDALDNQTSLKPIEIVRNIYWNSMVLCSAFSDKEDKIELKIDLLLYHDLRGVQLRNLIIKKADFRGTDLRRADFSDTIFLDVDFSRADLRRSIFRNAEACEISFTGADLSDSTVVSSNFTGADFNGAKLKRINAEKTIFDEAAMYGADFQEASLLESDLVNADLRKASLKKVDFIESVVYGTEFSKSDLSGAKFIDTNKRNSIGNKENRSGFDKRNDFTKSDLRKIVIMNSEFQNAYLREANISGAELENVDLSNSVFIESDMSYTTLTNVKMNGSQASELDFQEADLRSVELTKADLNRSSFRNSRIDNDTCFRGSNFIYSDLRFSDSLKENLKRSNWEEISWYKATIKNTLIKELERIQIIGEHDKKNFIII